MCLVAGFGTNKEFQAAPEKGLGSLHSGREGGTVLFQIVVRLLTALCKDGDIPCWSPVVMDCM
jgi:hypothetical protein